jgi:DNA-binding GntR family transcriptional regulator
MSSASRKAAIDDRGPSAPIGRRRPKLHASRPLQPTDGLSLADALYNALRDEIIDGDLEPGARLREAEVAAVWGVSRTPAREALKKLKTEGLIVEVAGRGLAVSNPSMADILDAYEIREVLEGLAARLAAERAVETDIMMMASTLRLAEEAHAADDIERAVQLCVQFDSLIFTAARNSQLQNTIESLRTSHAAKRARGNIRQHDRRVRAISERTVILEAIQARDAERAAEAAREHLRQARTYWVERSLQNGSFALLEPAA